MKRFDDIRTNRARAVQLWQILIGAAHNRQVLTYGIVAKLVGYGGASPLGNQLGYIMEFCIQNNLPPLTILVVNKNTGVPGEGLVDGNLHELREAVFQYDWYGLYPPSEGELDEAWQNGQG